MEKVPPGIKWEEIHHAICQVSGISDVHDLHIWSVSHGDPALSLHATAEDVERAFDDIREICHRHNITNMVLQIQPTTYTGGCATCKRV